VTPKNWLYPNWPAPPNVRSVITTRAAVDGATSAAPFDHFNLATHVGDVADSVHANRLRLQTLLGLTQPIPWLNQVHGTHVATHVPGESEPATADAGISRTPGLVCAILTADCLPILLCTKAGDAVAAVHAGWRGLLAGVIEATVAKLAPPNTLMAYIGPAIGPAHFQVGPEVRDAFVAQQPGCAGAFQAQIADRFLADLPALAHRRLVNLGVQNIFASGLCTANAPDIFYSHRQTGPRTGRFASMIWLA
jgi:polyphenol oxidase